MEQFVFMTGPAYYYLTDLSNFTKENEKFIDMANWLGHFIGEKRTEEKIEVIFSIGYVITNV